jgi:hypothetical protein
LRANWRSYFNRQATQKGSTHSGVA